MPHETQQPSVAETSILSVDDNPMIGDVVRMLVDMMPGFAFAGHLPSEVGVIEKIRDDNVGVLVLDYEIPGTDTLKLIRRIKSADRNCRVLMLSAHARLEIVDACRKAGASGYAVKDSDPKQLIKILYDIAKGQESFEAGPSMKRSSLSKRLRDYILGTCPSPPPPTPHLNQKIA